MVEKSTTDLIDWYTINQLNGCIPWLIIYPLFSTDKIPRFVIVTFLHGRMHSWALCRNAGIRGQGDARNSKPYLNQGRQIIPTPLLLAAPPPYFQTFRHPCNVVGVGFPLLLVVCNAMYWYQDCNEITLLELQVAQVNNNNIQRVPYLIKEFEQKILNDSHKMVNKKD